MGSDWRWTFILDPIQFSKIGAALRPNSHRGGVLSQPLFPHIDSHVLFKRHWNYMSSILPKWDLCRREGWHLRIRARSSNLHELQAKI